MNKKRLYIVLWIIVCLAIWFFAWQEYQKYKIKKAFTEAFCDFWNIFSDEVNNENNGSDNTSNKTIKDKDVENQPVADSSVTIIKWSTESISSKYNSNDVEAEITLNDVSFIDEIKPPEPTQSYYHYYPEKEGKTYAVISLKLKNIWGSSFDISDVLRNTYSFNSNCSAKAVFWWKYSYTADLVAELEKDNKWGYSYESTLIYIDPLETKDIIVAYSVPKEVKDKDAVLNICLWDKKIDLDFSEKITEIEEPSNEIAENSEW